MNNENIIVSIQCMVYNHEPYLRQCLDGFVIQKTNFKFEAIVHDDASTDSSAAIIREYAEKYPNIIKPIFETENQYSKRNGSLNKIMNNACKGKYIALCEGDDYWIDPLKLQKQVDFLDNNLDYGLIHTNFVVRKGTSDIYLHDGANRYSNQSGNIFNELFNGCNIKTLTVCYRRELLSYNNVPEDCFDGDLSIFYEIAYKSKIFYDNNETGVYRIVTGSASHSLTEDNHHKQFSKYRNLDYYIANKYNVGRDIYDLLDQKWFKYDFKHSLRASDYQYYKSINRSKLHLCNDKLLLLCYQASNIRLIFYIFSVLIRIKNLLQRTYKFY